jgi:hypothetical protein
MGEFWYEKYSKELEEMAGSRKYPDGVLCVTEVIQGLCERVLELEKKVQKLGLEDV